MTTYQLPYLDSAGRLEVAAQEANSLEEAYDKARFDLGLDLIDFLPDLVSAYIFNNFLNKGDIEYICLCLGMAHEELIEVAHEEQMKAIGWERGAAWKAS